MRTKASLRLIGRLAMAGFVVAVIGAGFLAWVDALHGNRMVTWEPTPRPSVTHG